MLHKSLTLLLSVLIAIFVSLPAKAQCTVDFTYSVGAQSLHQFNAVSTPPPAQAESISWYVTGPYIEYSVNGLSPSFYFPVNGSYRIAVQARFPDCSTYKIDTIEVTNLTPSGSCEAGMSYFPTVGSQFQFTDQSTASDSIACYFWYGLTYDTFLQVLGAGQENPVMTLYGYNCFYEYYYITHAITTISGCQSVVTDTVNTYCEGCLTQLEAAMNATYDVQSNTYSFYDVSQNSGTAGQWYWQFLLSDTILWSTVRHPVVVNPPSEIIRACLAVYDTLVYCRSEVCDTVSHLLSTGIPPDVATENLLDVVQWSNKLFVVKSNTASVLSFRLFDLSGRLVWSFEGFAYPYDWEVEIPLHLSGLYLVAVQQGNKSVTKRALFY